MNVVALRSVADLSHRYRVEYLARWAAKKAEYRADWFAALDFFLSHVFFQGRRDQLSEQYYRRAAEKLGEFFSDGRNSRAKRFEYAWQRRWIPHTQDGIRKDEQRNLLMKALTEAKAGKRRDREMVLDVLRYIHGLAKWNIVTFSLSQIKRGKIRDHCEELQQLRQIGPKTASFYLRDLCAVYGLRSAGQDLLATQPIDTWVRTISAHLDIISREDPGDDDAVKAKIIAACTAAGVSPADYNAGAWYLGTHSLALALESLGIGSTHVSRRPTRA